MEHDAICEYCGAIVPCCEGGCMEPPLHPYICEDCLQKERDLPHRSYIDLLDPEVRFGDL